MEHKLISGGEQYLPFARSRIKALRAMGSSYASQRFDMDDGVVEVRIAGQQDYITLTGGGGATSVYANVQFPQTDAVITKIAGRGTLYTGSYPAGAGPTGGAVSSVPYENLPAKTRFGTSPFSARYLKMTLRNVRRGATSLPYVLEYDIVGAAGVLEQIRLNTSGVNSDIKTKFTDFVPTIVSVDAAVVSTIDADISSVQRDDWAVYLVGYNSVGPDVFDQFVIPPPDPEYWKWLPPTPTPTQGQWSYVGPDIAVRGYGPYITGTSAICIRKIKQTPAGDSYTSVLVGSLPFEDSKLVVEDHRPVKTIGNVTYKVLNRIKPFGADVATDLNDLRRRHALERVSVAPNGMTFVLRETSLFVGTLAFTESGNSTGAYTVFCHYLGDPVPDRAFFTGVIPSDFSWDGGGTNQRGYTLSMVTKDNVVLDHVVAGDIGLHGYIDGIFTSADGRHCYVYYGLHDPSEASADMAYPTKFFEYLDKIAIKKNASGAYTFTKTTISLGSVSHTQSGLPDKTNSSDYRVTHYASKLHGASVEVSGRIWADRFVYDIQADQFFPIPGYIEHVIVNDALFGNRDPVTGANADRMAYMRVAAGGVKCDHYLRTGEIQTFDLSTVGGVRAVRLSGSAGYPAVAPSIYENQAGVSFRFSKPGAAT